MTKEEKADLALKVFDTAYNETETFREENMGADLAYLMGAILDTGEVSYVDWSSEVYGEEPPALLEILKRSFSEDSTLWNFILLDDANSHKTGEKKNLKKR
ncbi:hypothetical protein L0156_15350 [bacterium]|nr:hypothetical protein [bacterium]